MKIEGFGSPHQTEPKDKKVKESEKSDRTSEVQKTVSDSVELNKNRKQINNTGYSQKLAQQGASDIALKKDLSELKNKTSNGYYDKHEIRERTSDRLIDSKVLKDVVKQYHLSNTSKEMLSNNSNIRHEKVADTKQKVVQGFYNDPQNFGKFADKIINHFGL